MCLCLVCRGCAGRALRRALCCHSTGLPAVHLQAPQPEHTVSDGELQEEGAQGVAWVQGTRRVKSPGQQDGLAGPAPTCSNAPLLPTPPGWTHQPNPRSSTQQPPQRTPHEPCASAMVPAPPVQPLLAPTPGQGSASTPAPFSCTGCPHRLFAWGGIWPQQIFLL